VNGFRLVGWGTLVVLIDVRVSGVDVLVDLVGWALIYFGLRAVWKLDNALRIACGFAFLGALLAVAELAFGSLAVFPLMVGTYLGPATVVAAVTAVLVVVSYVLLVMDRRVARLSTQSSQSIT
jgi:uncharacterized membrane protein